MISQNPLRSSAMLILSLLVMTGIAHANPYKVEIRKDFYPSGKVHHEYRFVNGKLDGITRVYLETGELKEEMNFVAGVRSGINRDYHPNGQLHHEYTFENGKLNGKTTRFDDKGNLVETLVFKDGKRKE